jgi:hypothetical protein
VAPEGSATAALIAESNEGMTSAAETTAARTLMTHVMRDLDTFSRLPRKAPVGCGVTVEGWIQLGKWGPQAAPLSMKRSHTVV